MTVLTRKAAADTADARPKPESKRAKIQKSGDLLELSAEVWAKAMSYLRLSEQFVLAKASRQLLREVPPLLVGNNACEDFVISDPEEMRGIGINRCIASHFTSIKEVHVVCLVTLLPNEDGSHPDIWHGDMRLCEVTARYLIPFLSMFPSLESVHIGGIEDPKKLGYNHFEYSGSRCKEPPNHAEIYRGLVQTFCDAYRARTIPQSLSVGGLIGDHEKAKLFECGDCREGACQLCQNIARTFPLEVVLKIDTKCQYDELCMETFMDVCNHIDHEGAICLSHDERIQIVASRPGGKALIATRGLNIALSRNNHLVGSCVRVGVDGSPLNSGRSYIHALDFIHCRPWQGALVEFEACVKHGADASKIGYEELVNRYFPTSEYDHAKDEYVGVPSPARGTLFILQDSFERLVGLGFDIRAEDFRQVISVEDMEWGYSIWPRFVHLEGTDLYTGNGAPPEMNHIWTFWGPLTIGPPEQEHDEEEDQNGDDE